MPDAPTPGEIAYETYWGTWNDGLPPALPWDQIIPDNKRAWEAAAQAVVAMQEEAQPGRDTPITDQLRAILRCVGQIVHAGTQRDLDKLHLWLADYAETIGTRRPAVLEARRPPPNEPSRARTEEPCGSTPPQTTA